MCDYGPRTFKFNLQAGPGGHYFFSENFAGAFEYRSIHISNAGIDVPNHGGNTSTYMLGASWFFKPSLISGVIMLRTGTHALRHTFNRLFFSRLFAIVCPVEALDPEEVSRAVATALAEDIGSGAVTTLATVPETSRCTALMRARVRLVLAGLSFAETAFRQLSSEVQTVRLAQDGKHIPAGKDILRITGPARAVLTAERVALNFVQRLSGVATLTARFVEAVTGTGAGILDTRKTTPGWRRFEKYAVACGGGRNHRMGLHDMVLIKDNHLASLRDEAPNPVAAAVRRAREQYPALKVEVETDTLEQVDQALASGADMILLDNMSLEQMRAAVGKCKGRATTEASGGVTLATVRGIAETGVDLISVGALTHSAYAVDIGLDFEN